MKNFLYTLYGAVFIVFGIAAIANASDIYDVTNYTLFHYIPFLIIPFLAGLIIIGLVTRFAKSGMNL